MKFIKIPGKDFEMGETPVTQKQYKKIMGVNPSYYENRPSNPVEMVSWDDTQKFCKKLNTSQKKYIYRLPTEAEWEYCAKSSDDLNILYHAVCWENSNQSTQPVKSKTPNSLGLYDMLGNVWGWCEDKYDTSSSNRVIRGGSWGDYARGLRSASRGVNSPGYRSRLTGFRLLRTFRNSKHSYPITLDKEQEALKVAIGALKKIEEILK